MGLLFSLAHGGMEGFRIFFLDTEVSILDAEISEFFNVGMDSEAARLQED